MRFKRLGFTLIELLIVVAIIAILAAIAVPNFLEAQVRSKVSRVHADLRTYATALEAYQVDTNHYPPDATDIYGGTNEAQFPNTEGLTRLSTPISYMSSAILIDPFGNKQGFRQGNGAFANAALGFAPYFYTELTNISFIQGAGIMQGFPYLWECQNHRWNVSSAGPARFFRFQECARTGTIYTESQGSCGAEFCWEISNGLNIYDPTNGTVSVGAVRRTGLGLHQGQKTSK
jgi:type II secretion system protein G